MSTFFAMALAGLSGYALIAAAVIYGGLGGILYPMSVAYTNDFLAPEDLVPAAGGLVMAYGIGAVVGPPVAALFIEAFCAAGLFHFTAIVGIAAAAVIALRMRERPAPTAAEQTEFQIIARTSPLAGELDPRGDANH